MIKICLCPTSIAWITRNLKKSAKAQWRKMIKRNKPTKRRKTPKRKAPKRRKASRKGGKRRLSPGVHWVTLKGGKRRKVRVNKKGQWRFMKG